MIIKKSNASVIEKEYIHKLFHDLYYISELNDSIEDLSEKTIFEVYSEDNKLMAAAMLSKPSKSYYTSLLESFVMLDTNEVTYEELFDDYKDYNYLDCIKSFKEGLGCATFLIDYIFQEYGSFWLYSSMESEDFWENKGLSYLGNYCYLKEK